MLPNNEVRVPPRRVLVQEKAVPRDITAEFTEAASSRVDPIPTSYLHYLTLLLSYRTTDWPACQR
jgi:hypothetical protein